MRNWIACFVLTVSLVFSCGGCGGDGDGGADDVGGKAQDLDLPTAENESESSDDENADE